LGGVAVAPDATAFPRLGFDPPSSPDEVQPVTRLTIEFSEPASDPRVVLFSGALTPAQLRDFGRPPLPQSLAARAVSALVWLEPEATRVVVAPLVPLEPGAIYTVALGAPLSSIPFTVATGALAPLARVWPDHDEVAPSVRAAVWCGANDLGSLDVPATLEPALLAGRLAVGTGAPFAVPRCVGWFSGPLDVARGAAPAVAPPAVALGDGSSVSLEPTLLLAYDGAPAGATACAGPEIPFGPACAEVEDDRAIVRPGDDPLLWTIDVEPTPVVRSSRGGKKFTLRGLPASGVCRVSTLDRSGQVTSWEISVVPALPRPHVVLNEVMANPLGAEPAQEWIELYNDGSDPVRLGGFAIEDAGGRSVLPDGELAPGTFALVVSEMYVADDGADPPPAPGTTILRVPMLGRSGLSNDGERLTLRDVSGTILSAFPAAKAKNGVSVARIAPDAPDDDPASFVPSPNESATPGARNIP
jgi:hypothetical protein